MRFTISGFWTAIIVVMFMTVILYIITRNSELYKFVKPNIVITFALLIILRVTLLFELIRDKGIYIPEVMPMVDKGIRYSLFRVEGNDVTLWMILALVWAVVSSIKIGNMIHQYIFIRNTLNLCKDIDDGKLDIVKTAEQDMRVSGQIFYKISDNYCSPFILGLHHPVIVLPNSIKNLPENEFYMMIRHELSHYKRKDCVTKVFLEIFNCIFWWFPFLKHLISKLDEAIEMRADWNTIKNMSEEQKTEYLVTLYHVAKGARRQKDKVLFSNMFTSGQVNSTEKRFKFIVSKKKWFHTNLLIVILIAFFISSYFIVIEPEYIPNDGAIGCESICTVYQQEDGKYSIYMDGEYLGIVENLEFLEDPNMNNVVVLMEEEKDD